MLLLGGCTQKPELDPITESTLVVAGNGSITYYLVEDFEKEYYDVLELNRMAAEEAAAYNEKLGRSGQENPPVEVRSVEMVRDGSQRVVLQYALRDADIFQDFFGRELFFGTLAQATAQGLPIPESVYDTGSSGKVLNQAEIAALSTWHIIITRGGENVLPPKSPKYLSEGAVLRRDGLVIPGNNEDETYMIYK
jgi:hypothetical protein